MSDAPTYTEAYDDAVFVFLLTHPPTFYSEAIFAFVMSHDWWCPSFDEIKARVIKPMGNRDERPCLDE